MPNESAALEREQNADLQPPAPINPFGKVPAVATNNAAAETDQARAIAEVQGAMVIAQRFPRNEIEAMDKILNAFTRPSLAEVAQYQYAKGGSDIRGPSIRALEAIAQLWGHVHSGVEELDRRNGVSTVRTFAFDAQTGSRDSKIFQVEHVRHTKKGSYKLEDPREIYELVANQAARRKRACLQAVIPGDVIEQSMKQADVTLHTKAEVTPERLASLVQMFAEYGVTKEAIEARIQRRLEAMSPAQMVNLGKIFNSLKDGMSAAADWFEPETPPNGTDAPAVPKRGAAGLKAAVSGKGNVDKSTGEVSGPTYAQIMEKIKRSNSKDEYDDCLSLISSLPDAQQQKELRDEIEARTNLAGQA